MDRPLEDELFDAADTSIERLRHTASHIMAQAVLRLWPDAKFGVGPTIENGFYYDIHMEHRITDEDLRKIEAEMKKIVKKKLPLTRKVLPRDEAVDFFKNLNQDFKMQIIADLPAESEISLYEQGEFIDLCRGPHLEHTGKLHYFKLLSIAGAYWRGNDKNPMLQRIYGTAWETKEELKTHLHNLEEAKKRDHRKLIKDLDLVTFHPLAPAMPFFLPKGTIVYNQLVEYVRHHYLKNNYKEVITPQIFDADLWKTSGHYDHYLDGMFFVDPGKISEKSESEREFGIKPMNCPSHCLLYGARRHSYKELPLRIADFGRLHRYEKSGATAGLTRVRSMSQDDAHIFCTMDQIKDEITDLLKWCFEVYELFDFKEIEIGLSTRPEGRVGTDEIWDQAETALADALKANKIDFKLNPGDGAFYGPKIDFNVKDAIGRSWQLSTCQLDFNLPERFDLTYVKEDGSEERPVMIHRAILGTIERFMGVLIEHLGGAFPFWLAPIQAVVVPIGEAHLDYCKKYVSDLKEKGFRVELDDRSESMGKKTREAQTQKIPFMLAAGDREIEGNTFSVRKYQAKQSEVKTQEEIQEEFKTLNEVWK